MGQAASGQASNALTSIRVLFLDMDNPVAYKLTAGLLHKHSEVTVVLATEDNVAVEVNRADVIVTIEAPLSKGVIARAAVLKLICQFGNDVSRIDLQAAAAANISVTHIPSKDAGIAESSAEHAIGLAFSVLRPRSVPSARGSIGKNLCGMTAVVVGNGGIGQRLTFLLQAMGSDASCVDPSNVDLLEEIGNADILFFCCAVTEKLKKLVNLQFLTSTKEGAYIVSISRNELFNLDDLAQVLTISGRISGVAFDSRIAVTKHLVLADPAVYVSGSAPDATEITYKCMSHITAGNIMRALRGDQLEDVVPIGAADADPEAIKRAGNTEVAALKLMK